MGIMINDEVDALIAEIADAIEEDDRVGRMNGLRHFALSSRLPRLALTVRQ